MNVMLFDHLEAENRLASSDFRYAHIVKVLHLRPGDRFSAGIVDGAKGTATLQALDGTGCTFAFVAEDTGSSTLYPVVLLVGQVRPICMKRILRETVSLGVEGIVLVGCDLAERSYAKARFYTDGTYRSVLLDGAMQSGMTGIPSVTFADSVDRACTLCPAGYRKIVLDNVLDGKPLSSWERTTEPVVLAIGPERGFSDRERHVLLDAAFVPASFGRRILRTETACSAALGVLMGRMGLL